MDQTLKLKIEKFKKAIQTLKDALKQRENEIIKDATIKRFEYCFELGWKTAKVLLDKKFGVKVYSPKECFRELTRNQVISSEETESFLEMTDYRNQVVRTYSQDFADIIYDKIKNNYSGMLEKLLKVVELYARQK